LKHGRNASAASDHAKVADHVGRVDHGTLGALDLDLVSKLHASKVLRDVASGVGLDNEVDIARVLFVRCDGRVGAHNLLAVDGSSERNVLAYGQAEGVERIR
jgi:hypothetical protein